MARKLITKRGNKTLWQEGRHCLLSHGFLPTCLAETSPLISLPPVPLGGTPALLLLLRAVDQCFLLASPFLIPQSSKYHTGP